MTSSSSAAEAAALLDHYLTGLDSAKLDDHWTRGLFTPDASVEFPNARHEGIEGLAEFHRKAMSAFARTQHLNSPAAVVVDDGQATLRANLISTHVHHGDGPDGGGQRLFTAGTFLQGRARRTAEGWRLCALEFRLVWSTGHPPRPAR
jgi:hypothetical protein